MVGFLYRQHPGAYPDSALWLGLSSQLSSFERVVHVVAKSPPQHRTKSKKASKKKEEKAQLSNRPTLVLVAACSVGPCVSNRTQCIRNRIHGKRAQ